MCCSSFITAVHWAAAVAASADSRKIFRPLTISKSWQRPSLLLSQQVWQQCSLLQSTMCVDGKRTRRRSAQLISTVGSSELLHAVDTAADREYLVDSGAQVSVFPHFSRQQPFSFLLAADGRRIPAWDAVSLPVTLNGRQFGLQRFVRAAVDQPILGADFFTRTGLLIDLKNRRLLPPPSPNPASSLSPPPSPPLTVPFTFTAICWSPVSAARVPETPVGIS